MRNAFTFIFTLVFLLVGLGPIAFADEIGLRDLRCENLQNPVAIDSTQPHFSWKIAADYNGAKQSAFQILVASTQTKLNENDADLWNPGRFDSDQSVFVAYEGKPLKSGSQAFWKVRVWDGGRVSAWSEPAKFGIGLLEPSDWQAEFITPPRKSDEQRAFLLRKKFTLDEKPQRCILHINTLGYHVVCINGEKVGPDVLSPAVSQFEKHSMINSYDVTNLLVKGENDLVLLIGYGWYKKDRFANVHETPLVRAQLEVINNRQNEIMLKTDNSWQGRESEFVDTGNWRPHGFGGEILDARKRLPDFKTETLDAVTWEPVRSVDLPNHKALSQMVEPNVFMEGFEAKTITKLEENKYLVDFGTCVTGITMIRFPDLPEGHEIALEYSDYMNKDGVVEQQPQVDRYIASGKGDEMFCNVFNYHGYRYITISNLPKPIEANHVGAVLVQTDFKQASTFECSDADINAIHDMMQYTLKCLSIGGVFCDCPQYERLGYGGDGNSSLATASMMYDLSPFYYHWLQAWKDELREDGSLPHVAPHPNHRPGGGPFWCGFIITAAWNNYLQYGDDRALQKHYDGMKLWLSYAEKHFVDGLLKKWPETDYRHWYLGDWATPDGIDQQDEKSVDLVNNCFMVRCYTEISQIAKLLGRENESTDFLAKADTLKKRVQETFFDANENSYSTGTQIDLVYPMLVGVTPENLVSNVRERLFANTQERYKGHLACGLVGLPVLADWVSKTGEGDFMFEMLKKRDYPGFLYMIDNGATTTWEHWNAKRSRIHNCYNALGPFFYGMVGGLHQVENSVAWRKFRIDFNMPQAITSSKITKETPYGTIRCERERNGNQWEMTLTVPVGATAILDFPDGVTQCTLNGKQQNLSSGKPFEIASGTYSVTFAAP